MPDYVAFLRGINLGRRRIKMKALRALVAEMGFTNVDTFIASGNVLFSSPSRHGSKLAKQIQEHLERSLGYTADTFVRTREEVAGVAAFQPFPPFEMTNPANTVHVGFWNEAPTSTVARGLPACRTDVDEFRVNGREFYWLCRIRTPDSKVWSSPKLKALGLPSATMRNLTSLRKVAAQYPPATAKPRSAVS